MSDPIRVLIADDHPIFRSGLRQILASQELLEVVDEVADGELALQRITELRPHVAVLDIDMPKRDGIGVMKRLRDLNIDVPVIFLTMYDDREMFDEAMDLGVRGYVLKEGAVREIVDAIRSVADGRYYVSPSLSALVVSRSVRTAEMHKSNPGLAALTATERSVLRYIAEGKTSKEIAAVMNVSSRTIDNHRLNISQKLGVHGTHALVKFAVQHKSSF